MDLGTLRVGRFTGNSDEQIDMKDIFGGPQGR